MLFRSPYLRATHHPTRHLAYHPTRPTRGSNTRAPGGPLSVASPVGSHSSAPIDTDAPHSCIPPPQNAQIRTLLTKLRREGRELVLTWWVAEDCADDCLISAPLPVPRLRQHISDRFYHTSGSNGGLGLHAHMDAGMMIATGDRLREVRLLRARRRDAPSVPVPSMPHP